MLFGGANNAQFGGLAGGNAFAAKPVNTFSSGGGNMFSNQAGTSGFAPSSNFSQAATIGNFGGKNDKNNINFCTSIPVRLRAVHLRGRFLINPTLYELNFRIPDYL